MKVLFTIAPDKKVPANRVNLGAIFTTFGIIIVTDIYSYYITHFAHYDIFYAGLSNIAILMLWIYFLSYIIVIGISLTSKFDDDLLPKTGVIN
jgi:membrane protein